MGDIKTYNIGNIENAQFFTQSLDYQSLTKRIAEKREMVEYLQATGKTERALTASAELGELETELEQFKENVFKLYETFTKVEIDTARLAQAKAHFDKGEFREADAVLNAEEMAKDLDRLIERDQQLDKEKATVAKDRGQLSNEYLVKARLRATFYDQPNRFIEVCQYFEEALKAARTTEAVFEYGLFLQNHNDFKRAKPLYMEALRNYRELAQENPRTYLPDVAMTLNNLAVLQKAQNDYELAASSYDEALNIRRELAKENPRTYLPDVAMTLNNLAVLQSDQNDYELAASSYDEALNIYRELAKENPRTYLPDVAMTVVNLSIFYLQAIPDAAKSIALAEEVIAIAQDFPNKTPLIQQCAALAQQVLEANNTKENT